MNITSLNRYNNYQNYQNNKMSTPVFASKLPDPDMAGQIIEKSRLFEPLLKVYDKFTDGIAKYVTSGFINSKPIMWLGSKFRNTENLFQHTLTVGSLVTSGMYVQKTLTNKKDFDNDRKYTLAANQTLTFGLSTIGAYALDKYVKKWWSGVTERFAGHLLNDKEFVNNFHAANDAIKASNDELLKAVKKGQKPMLKKFIGLEEFVKQHPSYKAAGKSAENIISKINGMTALRTMIVFGFVYRFFVPVAVTKPTNKLCEIYLQNKKAKEARKNNIALK